jgi:glycosyltransferase involved in cell wall biosynthesis
MKQNIRVLHVGPDVEARGGIASVLHSLKEHSADFARLGFDFDFLATTPKKSTRVAVKAFSFARALGQFTHRLLWSDADIVHLHTALHGSLIRKSLLASLCVVLRKPYIMHVHNGAFVQNYLARSAFGQFCTRQVLQRAKSVIILSSYNWKQMTELQLVAPGNCHVVFNGLEDPLNGKQPKHDRTPSPLVLTFLGLISAAKGIPTLISAIANMRRDLPTFVLRVGGIGDVEGLQNAVEKNGVAHIVSYLGWLDGAEKAAALSTTDIFVLPSRSEGFSVAILEAMAYGTAILSTNISGVVDAIRADVDGILVEPDNVPALTAALEQLVLDSSGRKRLGESARQRYLDLFTHDRMTERLVEIYAG